MKLLVTGASGFLGRFVVAEALQASQAVRAVVRPASDLSHLPWRDHAKVELARVDLRSKRGLADAVRGVDAVIHLAADKTGDFYAQFAANVVASENLLGAMHETSVKRLIAVSTFSVYDVMRMRGGRLLDEQAPIERDPIARDDYAQSKLEQERIVNELSTKHGFALTIVRPGVIYGKDNLWNAWLGFQPSDKLWVRTGANAIVPLTYVENCAQAILACAVNPKAIGETFNVVDDQLPTQRRYIIELAHREESRPMIFPIAWTVLRLTARSIWLMNRLLFRGRAKAPSILVPARLHARAKPLRYCNEKIKQMLGWTPRYSLNEAIDRSLAHKKTVKTSAADNVSAA